MKARNSLSPEGGILMGHTQTKILIHSIFCPKHRDGVFTPAIRKEVHPFLGGILRNIECLPIAINGTDDHVHVLAEIPAKLAVAEVLMKLKANSSRWIKQRFRLGKFEWQEGYSAFSVGPSKLKTVEAYIANQEEHHRKVSFTEELRWFCESHGVSLPEWMA